MLSSDTDASLKWCSTPPLWHIDAAGGAPTHHKLGSCPLLPESDRDRAAVKHVAMCHEETSRSGSWRGSRTIRQVLPYFGQKLPWTVWLGHIIVAASLSRLLFVAAQGIGGDRNDRDRA
jgi:hypothetical protein